MIELNKIESKYFNLMVDKISIKEFEEWVYETKWLESELIAVEGPGWLHKNLNEIVKNKSRLAELMNLISKIETAKSIMGISTHFIIHAKK